MLYDDNYDAFFCKIVVKVLILIDDILRSRLHDDHATYLLHKFKKKHVLQK